MGTITYKKLFNLLKSRGLSETNWLRQQGYSPTLVNKLRKDKCVTTDTLVKLCDLLECTPEDIMEYHSDNDTK